MLTTTETERLIHQLKKTAAPVSSRTVSRILAELHRLVVQDQLLDDIREACGLPACPAADLPGHIENIISNLASWNVELDSHLGVLSERVKELEALFRAAGVISDKLPARVKEAEI